MKHAMALFLLLPALTVSVPASAAETCTIDLLHANVRFEKQHGLYEVPARIHI